MLFLSPCNLSGSLPSAILQVPDDWIYHQPTLIRRILDIAQLHKNGSGSGMGKLYISCARSLCRKNPD